MKKILYVHGLGSGANSSTTKMLRDYFKNDRVYAVELTMNYPYECIKKVNDSVSENGIDVVIGSSMGGFFAMQAEGAAKILINPCLSPCAVLPQLIGINEEQEYFTQRLNGEKHYTVTDKAIREYKIIGDSFFTVSCNEKMKSETYVVLGTEDKVITASESLALIGKFNENHIYRIKGMEHRAAPEALPVIEKIINGI